MKKVISLVLAVFIAVSLAACSGGDVVGAPDNDNEAPSDNDARSDNDAPSDDKDTLYLLLRGDIGSLSPQEMVGESENFVKDAIYMSLFYMALETGEIHSDACENWEVNDDATEYTFHLREGIKFHNDKELKASDVVYSVNVAKESPAQMAWSVYVDKAEALDEYTVKISMLQPQAAFLQTANITLLHEETTVAAGEAFREHPIGCGPYEFVSLESAYQLTLKAYGGYIDGKPEFENVVYRIITDPYSALLSVESGEADFTISTMYNSVPDILVKEELNYFIYDNTGIDYIVMDNNTAPFDNLDVRLAINYAIDSDKCSQAYTSSLAVASNSILTSTVFGYSDAVSGYPYDLELAKKHLADAGYPEGEGFPELKIETPEPYKVYAEVVQLCLMDIGIDSELVLSENTAFVTRLMQGDVPFGILSVGLGSDASRYSDMVTTQGAFNFAHYSNPKVDKLFAAGQSETSSEKRTQIYAEIMEILQQDAPYGLMCNQLVLFVYGSDLDFSYAIENRSMPYIRPQDVKRVVGE